MRNAGSAMRSRSRSARAAILGGQGDRGRQARARPHARKSGPTAPPPASSGSISRATSCISLPAASSMPLAQRMSGMSRAGRAREHGAHVLGRRDDQPGVAADRGRQRSAVARIAGSSGLPVKIDGIFVDPVDRRDHLGLERPQQGFAAARRGDLGQRRAPGAAADHAELHAFTPAPRTFSALRRAASAPAPARRARRSARRRSARRRPRRSSPHCRCTARPAAR